MGQILEGLGTGMVGAFMAMLLLRWLAEIRHGLRRWRNAIEMAIIDRATALFFARMMAERDEVLRCHDAACAIAPTHRCHDLSCPRHPQHSSGAAIPRPASSN